jgi:hypothetical protein
MRISLNRIFNGEREYLFTTKKNIRNYEWTEKEAEELYESITEIDANTKNNALELNVITIMKRDAMTKSQKIGKNSGVYDVHDGQQRLVTVSLLFAATRDVILEKYPDLLDSAKQVWDMVYPVQPRLDDVCRIELRKNCGNKFLHTILSRTDPDTGNALVNEDGDYKEMGSILPKEKSWRNYGLTKCDQQILTVYNYFRRRLDELKDGEKILELIDHLKYDVYLMVCIPSDAIIARNIVMGQGKGKNVEAVDYFKGMVCFSYNEVESVQDSTLESWNELCDEIGRKVLEDACLILAQRYQETRIQKNGEVSLMEHFLRDKSNTDEENSGEVIFKTEIEPAARALYNFRKGIFDLDENDESELPSLAFLRDVAAVDTCKEIEMAALVLFMRYNDAKDLTAKNTISLTLKNMESVALWMMITKPKPKPKDRFQRCLSIIDDAVKTSLTADEKTQVCDVLYNNDFGKSPVERKKVTAILERLNEYILVVRSKNRLTPMKAGCHIEHILPQEHKKVEDWVNIWTSSDASNWKQKLGNLALLDGKSNSKIGNKCFEHKKENLRNSPYPLTKNIAEVSKWDIAAVKANHMEYISLAKEVWKL